MGNKTTDLKTGVVHVDSTGWLDETELDALVFQTIKTNQDKNEHVILKIIKELVPSNQHHQLGASIKRLI